MENWPRLPGPGILTFGMSGSTTIAVNPRLLSWAREESGYDVERVADRLHVKEERVLAWEKGERQPTLRQVEALAGFLHRPLSVFFLPRPPQMPPLAAEYRHLPDVEPGHESPEFRLAIRQMVARRETTLNLMGEVGETVPEFRLSAHLREAPAEVGRRLREAIRIPAEAQLGWASEWEAWREWRAAIENLGVLVFQFIRVSLGEARGLSLLRMPMPVAAINGKEIPEAKSFTLLHEVAHLMLATGNEEVSAAREKRTGDAWLDVERFAESVAGHALLPEEALRAVLVDLHMEGAEWDIENVRRVARRFRVTPLATATRLREAGVLSWDQYRRWRALWEAHVAKLPPRRGGFATPMEKAVNRAGRPFAQLVLEALDSNRITPVEASRYLNLKYQHFAALREHVAVGPGDGSIDE